MKGFNLSALAIREGSITLFLIVALAAIGIFSYINLGRAEDPPFTVKTLTVVAAWPGATAKEMQDLVADPLEKRVQELQWYDRVETFTRPGLAIMMVTLKDTTPPKDVPEQFYQARKKLGDSAHLLPAGAYGPFINDEYSDVDFTVYAIEGNGLPERQLARVAESLRERILHVDGVRKVDIMGERAERIFVEFSYARLVNLGVSPTDVFAALAKQNVITPAGSIDTAGPQVFMRLDGAFSDLQKIRDTPIVSGGRSLRLSDIATVERGYEDPPSFLIHHNGNPALVLNVVMKDGWNGLKLGEALSAAAKTFNETLPVGVTFSKVVDQAEVIHDAIGEFMMKFFVALAIVLFVALVSLGWRVGIVVAAAVPLTLAIVLAVMLLTGRVLDRITLGALIISLGLLVDDAIIVIESMVIKLEEGFNRLDAAAFSWTQTAAPRLAGSLATIIGFLPVGFARSIAGEYAGNIFWVVGIALITSWTVAAIFTPYLGVKMLPEIKKIEGGAYIHIYNTPRYIRFRKLVAWAVDRKFLVAVSVLGIFILCVFGMGFVKQQFFPDSDRTEVLVEVQMPEGTSIETTAAVTKKVEDWLKNQKDAKIVTSYIGGGAPRFFLPYAPELPDPSFSKIVVATSSDSARDELEQHLRERIASGLAPEARIRVLQFVFGPYTHYPVMFRVMGPDIDRLREVASQVEAVMLANPNTRVVNSDWGERSPTVHFVLDQNRLQLIGLSPSDAALQLQFLLTGVPVTEVREDIRTVELVARSSGKQRLDPARLGDLSLQVSMEVQKALEPIIAKLPEGYHIEVGGNIEESKKANDALAPIFPVMMLLTLFVLVVQTRSLSGMTLVFLTAPLGLIGAVPALLLFGQPFGFNAILGLIGLAGILMRNTLILVEQIHENQKEGLTPYHAVVEATVQRSRPVILTALAAVLAFIELTSSVFWGSMAYVLVGGTFVGTALILLFLPALYSIWYRIERPLDGTEQRVVVPDVEPHLSPAGAVAPAALSAAERLPAN